MPAGSQDACPEAKRLLDAYTAELNRFHNRWPPFSSILPEDPRKPNASRESDRQNLRAARQAYWKHVDQHGCRKPGYDINLENDPDQR
jgi:hypothetical protein